jgi:hypothetical protein
MSYYLFLLPIHYLLPTEWQYRPGGNRETIPNRHRRWRQLLPPTVETLCNDAGRTVRRIVITGVSLYLIFIR